MHNVLTRSAAIATLVLSNAAVADGPLPICYREDTAPFSYINDAGKPAGYTIELCKRVAKSLKQEVEMVKVTSEDRFEVLNRGECDLLCEATTVTLKRRQDADFSYYTFLTGSALLYPNAVHSGSSEKVRVGYLQGTTVEYEAEAGNIIGGSSGQFVVVFDNEFESHEDALDALKSGEINGYLADREILEAMLTENPDLAETHRTSNRSLTYEPYAIAVRLGDHATRLKVDTALVELFRTPNAMRNLLSDYVPARRNDPLLLDLFRIQSIPD